MFLLFFVQLIAIIHTWKRRVRRGVFSWLQFAFWGHSHSPIGLAEEGEGRGIHLVAVCSLTDRFH